MDYNKTNQRYLTKIMIYNIQYLNDLKKIVQCFQSELLAYHAFHEKLRSLSRNNLSIHILLH